MSVEGGAWSRSFNVGMNTNMVMHAYPDSKVNGAHMGPTWVLSAPGGPHFGPMNLAILVCIVDVLIQI